MVQHYHHLSHQEVKALSKMMWLIKTRVIGCCCSLAQSYCKTKQSAKKSEIWSLLMTIGMHKMQNLLPTWIFFQLAHFQRQSISCSYNRAWPSCSKLKNWTCYWSTYHHIWAQLFELFGTSNFENLCPYGSNLML